MLGNLANHLRHYQGSIFDKREAVMCALQHAIEDIIDDPVEDGDSAKEVYHFLEALNKVDLWPLSKKLQSSTLQDVLKSLRRLAECRGTTDCNCQDFDFDIPLEGAAEDVERELKGLCLTCFKNGRLTWEEGNCSAGKYVSCSRCPSANL